jgi:hypothetical protein
MNIVMGYRWFQTSAGYHMERAFSSLGFNVKYVGLSSAEKPGYDSNVFLPKIIDSFHEAPLFYLWVDTPGRYFPFGIEELSIPTACYIIDVHLGTWRHEVAKFFDVVFIAQKDYVDKYRKVLGHDQVYWLPLAAAADVHKQQSLPRIYDVGFVGNIAIATSLLHDHINLNVLPIHSGQTISTGSIHQKRSAKSIVNHGSFLIRVSQAT